MNDRYLGEFVALTWAELGSSVAALTSSRRRIPLSRMRARVQRRRGAAGRWLDIASRAREAVKSHACELFPASAEFLEGAAQAGGDAMWELFTLYEIESEHLLGRDGQQKDSAVAVTGEHNLKKEDSSGNQSFTTSYYPSVANSFPPHNTMAPRVQRWSRGRSSAIADRELSGCTGVACSSGIVGQSEEVDPGIYDYGAQDAVFRLRLAADAKPALLYDPACSFCPIGIGVGDLCITRFSLFPKRAATDVNASDSGGGIPLVVILWELVLGCHSLERAVEFLQRIFNTQGLLEPMASGASLLLSQLGHGVVIVEWSSSQLWLAPVAGEGALAVRANHCLAESSLSDDEAVEDMMEESKLRHCEVEEFIAKELCSGRLPPMTLEQVQNALSQTQVQNDSVLATVVACPHDRSLHVRFRIQAKEMALVEQTIQRNLWHHFSVDDAGRRKARWAKVP